MEKKNIVYKWFCKDYHSASIKMQVIKDFGDGTSLCQSVFQRSNGDEIVSGEKMVINNNQLFDEPLEVVNFNKGKDRLEEEREKLKQDLDVYKQSVKGQIDKYKKRVAWLKRVEKESHPEKIKELIRIMYMLLDSEDLYLFVPEFNRFTIIKFNMSECNNPLFKNVYDNVKLKLISLCPICDYDKINGQVQFCMSEYSDGSGYTSPFKLFNKIQDLRAFVIDYVDKMESINKSVIDYCEEWQIPIKKEKIITYYQDQLNYSVESMNKAINDVSHYRESIEGLQAKISQLNAQEK